MSDNIRLALMRQALALYDATDDGATVAACHLQAAVDGLGGGRATEPGEAIDPEIPEQVRNWLS